MCGLRMLFVDEELPKAGLCAVAGGPDAGMRAAMGMSSFMRGGRAKARFLAGFGFNVENWHALRDAIVAHAMANEITASHQTHLASNSKLTVPCWPLTVARRSYA